ncbi:MAG: beta-ketoacyl-ACP synthase III [Fusobacteriaceae bacterium]
MNVKNVGIVGIGSYVPEKIITNFDFEKIVDTSDDWIRTRTGIEERRFASVEQGASDLCAEAAKKALANARISASEIELIIVATCTPDHLIPSTACLVQKKIGADKAAAFDLNAACTGFVYALSTANAFVKAGVYKKVLVIGGETFSRIIDMQDRNTAILFGDGASAAVVQEVEEGLGIISTCLHSEGEDEGVLKVALGSKKVMTHEILDSKEHLLKMRGQEVFKFAVCAIPKSIEEVLKNTGLGVDDIDVVVPHQANIRILEASSKKIGIPLNKFVVNLNKYGNTSAASIGIALDEACKEGKIKKGDIVALTGFGGGLAYGAIILKWAF